MKGFVAHGIFVLLAVLPLQAGFDVPRHVSAVDELAEVKQVALEDEKFIAYVMADPGST